MGERKSIDYEDRRVALILDNTSSKLRAKTLAYRINISDADNISEIKGNILPRPFSLSQFHSHLHIC